MAFIDQSPDINGVQFKDQAVDLAAPSAGYVKVYTKAGVLYGENSAGVVTALANPGGANPSATAGKTVNNGVATTFMRSDATPIIGDSDKVDGFHASATPGASTIPVADGSGKVDSWVTHPTAANPTGVVGLAAVNGAAATFLRSDGAPAIDQSLVTNIIPGGRLTLTAATPVTTADVLAATNLRYVPYIHGYLPLYSGSAWQLVPFTDPNISLSGFTTSQPYDVFAYASGGVAAFEFFAWTSPTTRATALVYQDGRLCKTGALTRLYLGTIQMAATSQCEDSMARRLVWNHYNRTRRPFYKEDTTAAWTYTSTTWRQMRATAGNQVDWVIGYGGAVVDAIVRAQAYAGECMAGLGINSTSVLSGGAGYGYGGGHCIGVYRGMPAVGYSTGVMLERLGAASGTCTFAGTYNSQVLAYLSGWVEG